MRGADTHQEGLFSYVSPERRIPKNHPLREIRRLADEALAALSADFEAAYAPLGRPSIAPEKRIRALLLQVFYTIRSEWLLQASIVHKLFSKGLARARAAGLTSDEHFPVDGTLIEAWASMKSFRPKDEPPTPGPGRNREVDFRGESRTNDTHESTTDPDCRLYKKSPGAGARLCHLGNLVMEHRGGFIVNTLSVPPAGNAEREAAAQDPRGRQGLHHRVCAGVARNRPHPAHRSKRHPPPLGPRWPHHPPSGPCGEPQDPKAHRDPHRLASRDRFDAQTQVPGRHARGRAAQARRTAFNLLHLANLLRVAPV